jgi:hypothetical protein
MDAEHFAGMFQRSIRRAGVRIVRFHDLRQIHAAPLLFKKGIRSRSRLSG